MSSIVEKVVLMTLVSVMALSFAACNKDDNDDTNTNTPTATTIPPIENADAIMVGIKTITFINQGGFEFQQPYNTATAAFGNLQTGAFVDAGTVDVDGNMLEKVDNNAYVYTTAPTATNPAGIDFGSSYDWNVTGGSGFAAFSHTVSFGFPSIGNITSATGTISTATDYTLSIQNVSNADSVIYQIAGGSGNNNILVTKPGNATSHTFSAADLAALGSGPAILQVAAYKLDNDNKGGKTVYFINETVVSEIVELD